MYASERTTDNGGKQLQKSVSQIKPVTTQPQPGSLPYVYSFPALSPLINSTASAAWAICFQGVWSSVSCSLHPWESFQVCSLLVNSTLIRAHRLQIGPSDVGTSVSWTANEFVVSIMLWWSLGGEIWSVGPSLILGEKWANIIDSFHYTKTTNN